MNKVYVVLDPILAKFGIIKTFDTSFKAYLFIEQKMQEYQQHHRLNQKERKAFKAELDKLANSFTSNPHKFEAKFQSFNLICIEREVE